jgi:cysteine-rich repeat protein
MHRRRLPLHRRRPPLRSVPADLRHARVVLVQPGGLYVRLRVIVRLAVALPLLGAACDAGTSLAGDGTGEATDAAVDDAGVEEVVHDDGGARDDAEPPLDAIPPPDTGLPPTCGDLRLDPGEECDEGNRWNGDECDWLCRFGPGSFDYPPADDTVPALDPPGAAVELLAPDEPADRITRVQLVPRGSAYGLLYVVGEPVAETRVRVLDAGGHPFAGPWVRTELGVAPPSGLVATSDGYALFEIPADRSPLVVTFLDAEARQLGDPVPIFTGPPSTGRWRFVDVAPARDGFVLDALVEEPDASPYARLTAVSPAGVPLGPDALFYPPVDCSFGNPAVSPLGDGFACSATDAVVALDHELGVVGWTGFLHGGGGFTLDAEDGASAARAGGVLRFDMLPGEEDPTGRRPQDLVVTGVGSGGEVTLPPRVVQPGARPADFGDRVVADEGSCGVFVGWSWGDPMSASGFANGVRLFNTDLAGNPRSAPFELFPPETWPPTPTMFDMAAGATGGGLVHFVEPAAPRLVFRLLTCGG